MKRKLWTGLLVGTGLLWLIAGAAGPLAKPMLQRQFSRTLDGAAIGIEKTSLSLFPPRLEISGIEIRKTEAFSAEAKTVSLDFLGSRMLVQDAKLVLDNADASRPAPPAHGALKTLKIKNLSFRVRESGWAFEGDLSLEADLAARTLRSMDVEFTRFEGPALNIENLRATVAEPDKPGILEAPFAQIGPVRTGNLRGGLAFGDGVLYVTPLSFEAAGGVFHANARLDLVRGLKYEASVEFENLDILSLVSQMKWNDRFEMSGAAHGLVRVEGLGPKLLLLEGSLKAGDAGGELTIRDRAFLQNLADNTHQPIELIRAGLERYHFDTGASQMTLRDRTLNINLSLEGPAGKRDLNVHFHNLFGKKESAATGGA